MFTLKKIDSPYLNFITCSACLRGIIFGRDQVVKNSMATPTSIVNSVSHKTVQVSVNLITEYKT